MSCTCKYGSGVSCQFCQHRAHTNRRLEKLEAAASLLDEAYEKGRAAERDALRAQVDELTKALRDVVDTRTAGPEDEITAEEWQAEHDAFRRAVALLEKP